MDKGIGFWRNIRLSWLESAAACRQRGMGAAEMRQHLDAIVAETITGARSRRGVVAILVKVWLGGRDLSPDLHDEAVRFLERLESPEERLWLHYGLTLLAYPFFRAVAAEVGKLGRQGEPVTPGVVKRWLVAQRGNLGSLDKAVERVLFSLRDWGLLEGTERRNVYAVRHGICTTADPELELWLLACALRAHPAEGLPLLDLVRLPELFPFRLTVGADMLRRRERFMVVREGGGWDAVRLRE